MTLLNRVSGLDTAALADLMVPETDWDYIHETASLLGAGPLYYHHLKKMQPAGPGAALMESFRRRYYMSSASNLLLLHEFDGIAGRLAERGIPCMALKGVMLARSIYPVPALRPMFDIDMLVPREDLPGVEETLTRLGYHPMDGESPAHLPGHRYHIHYRKAAAAPVILEVHWGLGERHRYDLDEAGFWSRARTSRCGPHLEMCDDDTLLYLCLHFFKHFLFKRLSWLCDIHEWIAQKEIHWERLVESARSQSIATFLAYTLRILQDFYGTALPLRPEEIARVGALRRKVLGRYLRTYDMFHPIAPNHRLVQRLFSFSAMDRTSGRLKFAWDILTAERE